MTRPATDGIRDAIAAKSEECVRLQAEVGAAERAWVAALHELEALHAQLDEATAQ
jgi:hypothetical protein